MPTVTLVVPELFREAQRSTPGKIYLIIRNYGFLLSSNRIAAFTTYEISNSEL